MLVGVQVDIPDLGKRLKKVRESKKLSSTHIAAMAGISSAHLYRIENEDVKVLPRDTLKKLSAALDLDFDVEVKTMLLQENSM